jgi:hypothetical protein
VQAETHPEAVVVVTVRGRVPVAVGGAAVLWVVVPRTAAQHARVTPLHCRGYRPPGSPALDEKCKSTDKAEKKNEEKIVK